MPPLQHTTPPEASRWHTTFLQITQGNALISVLAVLLALIVGGIMIAFTDETVQEASGYFFARPLDTIAAIWQAVSGAYIALFQGSIYNFGAPTFARGIRPLTETLTFATPLIAAGLGVALAFRIGMFNIGGRGQMLMASAGAGWVAFSLDLPWGIHMIVALIAGLAAGALWAGIAGALKAWTGAHEVIVTIMLNYVAFYLISWMLRTPGLLQAPGSSNPKTPPMKPTAVFPELFGPQYNLHFGFILVILATVVVWWILSRSSLGFKFRAVGENPHAARVAGINVKSMYIIGMLIAGALVGLAGVNQVLGTITTGFSADIDAGIGFDAITVALLGRSTPWGTFAAGILFGAFKAGGFAMQAAEGVPIEIVTVVQALIVLFIAAPPLVRTIFFLPSPERDQRRREKAREKQLKAEAGAVMK
ncbi:ABC transporter permease [Microbacterium sp. zg.B48]|uniref:ABC transporter permease n=1 Tax=unclassified Microbacterium TaxID=2609290 RepID=UPI00214AB5BB|nr:MULTISPECIES: ABC transporter permease [unclassified Microbacterium]MCR2763973.1 ABC transporter permease [Microbacterium sp. zg.B48]MCR2810395.1 ABC transporter permease [Microbacterium sp. zg.B185]WIM20884.1 ABC transporter permease [Microbacterium sp. zg-B185]